MDKHPESENHQLDKNLADFTDQALSSASQIEPEQQDHDSELEKLERTVLRVKHAFGSKTPDPEMAKRIRKRLASEWVRIGMAKPEETARKVTPRRRASWISPQYTLLQLGFALVLLAVVVIFLIPEVQTGLIATAFKNPGLVPVAALVVITALIALFYFLRRK